MNRILSTTIAAASLLLATVTLAQPAQAITNPADNPHPITVKGDDGQKYTDGEDTLPGYDDEACTYIPGAYFDFDNNRVRYADGQSIPWTEWSRATGYKEWKAKKDAKPTAAAPTAPKTTAPKPVKTTAAPKAKPTAKPKTSATSKPAASSSTDKTAATPTPTPTATATSSIAAAAADDATKGDKDAKDVDAAGSEAAADDTTEEVALAGDTTDEEVTNASASTESNGTGSTGLLILAGLAGAGALAYAGYSIFGKNSRKGSAS